MKFQDLDKKRFELSTHIASTEVVVPRPTNLQDELWLQNEDVWQNVDSTILVSCYDAAKHSNHAEVSVADMLEALKMTTTYVLLDKDHQELIQQLLINHLVNFATEQHLLLKVIANGSKILLTW